MNENKKEENSDEKEVSSTLYSLDETRQPDLDSEPEESEVKQRSLIVVALILIVIALIFLVKVLSGGVSQPVSESQPVSAEGEGSGQEYIKVMTHEVAGDYLADSETDMTLYVVDVESCPVQCMKHWVPYAGEGESSRSGITSEFIESESQYHYSLNGQKLYHYTIDVQPGDFLGEGFYFVGNIARP